jgi:hypothetical protein
MLKMRIPDLNNIEDCISCGRKVALFTFLVGSTILISYYFYRHSSFLFFSLFFMVVAFFVNTYISLLLISFWSKNSDSRKKIVQTILLILVNIPIAYAYVKIGLGMYGSTF